MPKKKPRDLRAESLSRLEKDADVLSLAISRFEKQSDADTSDLRAGLAAIEAEISERKAAPTPPEVLQYKKLRERVLFHMLMGSGL